MIHSSELSILFQLLSLWFPISFSPLHPSPNHSPLPGTKRLSGGATIAKKVSEGPFCNGEELLKYNYPHSHASISHFESLSTHVFLLKCSRKEWSRHSLVGPFLDQYEGVHHLRLQFFLSFVCLYISPSFSYLSSLSIFPKPYKFDFQRIVVIKLVTSVLLPGHLSFHLLSPTSRCIYYLHGKKKEKIR